LHANHGHRVVVIKVGTAFAELTNVPIKIEVIYVKIEVVEVEVFRVVGIGVSLTRHVLDRQKRTLNLGRWTSVAAVHSKYADHSCKKCSESQRRLRAKQEASSQSLASKQDRNDTRGSLRGL